MSSRPGLPKTSKEAFKQVTIRMLADHHKKIIETLKVLKEGIYEDIASFSGLDRHQIGRRLKELEEKQIIYKPGTQKKTSKGRNAFIYKLCNPTESFDASQKSTSDIAGDIIKTTQKFIQPSLFV